MKYFYEQQGQKYMLSESETRLVEKCLRGNSPVATNGRTLYAVPTAQPSASDIRDGKTTRAAVVIRNNGLPTVRWYWRVREHKVAHRGCTPFGDGLCAFKMVRYFNWNDETGKWELLPAVNHATPEQEKVLDRK